MERLVMGRGHCLAARSIERGEIFMNDVQS